MNMRGLLPLATLKHFLAQEPGFRERLIASCATLLSVALLLALLLTAIVERNICLITHVNIFYAVAARVVTASASLASSSSSLMTEGRRALRTAIFMRRLQRVLHALLSGSQFPLVMLIPNLYQS
jgi:hypothetical protein